MGRTKYDKEYKDQAVRLSQVSGNGVVKVAEELGIQAKMLYRWRREAATTKVGQRVFPGHGRSRDEELAKLHKQLRQAELERDILKKAVTYFAQHAK